MKFGYIWEGRLTRLIALLVFYGIMVVVFANLPTMAGGDELTECVTDTECCTAYGDC